MVQYYLAVFFLFIGILLAPASSFAESEERPPNVIVIMADDLGVAELGCTGSQHIHTPHIDALFASGMVFTNGYSGSTVCAPSRCTLLTGQHTGRAQVRGNGEIANFTGEQPNDVSRQIGAWEAPPMPNGWWGGQRALEAETETIATSLKRDGYTTFATGKWGLGGPFSEGVPTKHGFDNWLGYLCQRNAHNYYPRYLAKDDGKVVLPGNERGLTGAVYATDLMVDAAVSFIEDHRDEPFFLYYATPVPHLALQVPEDSMEMYRGTWQETPYEGGRGYLPQAEPRATYAAMVTRFDQNVGRIMEAVRKSGQEKNTVVMFTSDNGSTFGIGGYDPEFFNGTGGLRGHKCNLYEGGIRVPLAISWPGHIRPGSTSDVPVANWDFFPTIMGLTGSATDAVLDGIDVSPVLLDSGVAPARNHLYWEYHPGGGIQAVRMGRWKGVRTGLKQNSNALVQLYDLEEDPTESVDVAKENPDIAAQILEIMKKEHRPSPVPEWNFLVTEPGVAIEYVWTGEGDGKRFEDPLNWGRDASANPVFIQSPFIIDAPNTEISAPRLDALGDGKLVLRSGVVTGLNHGFSGGQLSIERGRMERRFLVNSRASVSMGGILILAGAADPLNRSTVDLKYGGTLVFLGESPADVRSEHLSKITLSGAPAATSDNLVIQELPNGATRLLHYQKP